MNIAQDRTLLISDHSVTTDDNLINNETQFFIEKKLAIQYDVTFDIPKWINNSDPHFNCTELMNSKTSFARIYYNNKFPSTFVLYVGGVLKIYSDRYLTHSLEEAKCIAEIWYESKNG